ncbi:hypothetical protein TTHERM_01040830 (macronuclear) [Tetrahymena thermophila SB210]|uniref:Uncharacterized protein n=1 Tax=Tetrahymena thermophila (strain SB210) TaxID=312017 RepID=Q24DA3_TETTS|nr:hypothetical protein TTHERM_01040830 [Tetrahymena thermophila SB210]EAS05742.1 hypothetical protein TTHERM_01040830 [Tetrahymena thermophila SB210]|eukprot:XP_001025987.1 hypothetical protein TTHERM_01040830 [Tetrahymena thermophila SB210]
MDRIINNSQNFDQILCQKHNLPCLYLQVDSDNSDDIYVCSDCIYENNNFRKCLAFQDIKYKKDDKVLVNWPILDEPKLIKQIKQLYQYQGDQNLIQNNITDFFNDLQNEIEQTLQKQKKNMLIYADGISEKVNQLFEYYQEIAQFDALKNIIDSNTQKQQKADQILQIFKTNKQNQENYKNKIQQELSQLNQQQIIDLNVLKSFKDSILSQIELIDGKYLSNLQLFSQKNNILIEEFKKQQQNQNILLKENENLYTLLNLIANKTNNCNENYLKSVKSELLKIQDLINVLNIEKHVFQQGKKQIQIGLEKLSQDQIECIETLVNKTLDLNEQYQQLKEDEDNNMSISSKLQPSSYLVYNQMDNVLTKQKQESISKLLRRFPIFEIEQLVKPCKLEVEISNWGNYNTNGKQSYDNEGNYKFEIVKQGVFIFYMKIKQDCLYRIVINLELKHSDRYLFIGLVGKSHKDQKYIHDNSIINSFTTGSVYGDVGVSKVIKGKCLRDVKYPEEYNQIEITFCVKNKMFQVSDYPKRENINEINDAKINLIDINQEYYLGFQLFYDKESLTILECEELQCQN